MPGGQRELGGALLETGGGSDVGLLWGAGSRAKKRRTGCEDKKRSKIEAKDKSRMAFMKVTRATGGPGFLCGVGGKKVI